MFSATKTTAATALSSFVRCYSLSRFDTNGLSVSQHLHALHELSITFCLTESKVLIASEHEDKIIVNTPYYITGIATQCTGHMLFNGSYTLFSIHFKPNGFYKIWKLSPKNFLNKITDAAILGTPLKNFYGKLKSCRDIGRMQALADAFLLQYIAGQKSSDLSGAITTASDMLLKNININIERLAQYVNMSLRNFERRFDEQVGISPKLFCRIRRFNNALYLKTNSAQEGWSTIAQACGYFDQTHFIKDFKKFSGYSPSHFLKQMAAEENIPFFY